MTRSSRPRAVWVSTGVAKAAAEPPLATIPRSKPSVWFLVSPGQETPGPHRNNQNTKKIAWFWWKRSKIRQFFFGSLRSPVKLANQFFQKFIYRLQRVASSLASGPSPAGRRPPSSVRMRAARGATQERHCYISAGPARPRSHQRPEQPPRGGVVSRSTIACDALEPDPPNSGWSCGESSSSSKAGRVYEPPRFAAHTHIWAP